MEGSIAKKHAFALVLDIIREHFGTTVEKVSSALLFRGKMMISQIVQETLLELSVVQKSLLILIQHNCAIPSEDHKDREKEKIRVTFTFYQISPEDVLIRLRFPRFILIVKDIFQNEGELLIE